MRDALIVSAVRTPVGRAGGALADVRADDLAAIAVRGAVDRVSFDPARLDDVILGCTNQAGEDNRNVARMAALLAGFPVDVPGQTVNRLCGSGLQAIASAAQAIKAGEGDAFVAGVVPQDDHPRPEASADKLAALKPAFSAGGTVTAGNASGINDGASALLVVGGDAALGHTPLARVITSAVAGVDPSVMGIGPVPAVRKALKRAGLTTSQIDLWELNEAFASQSIACMRDLELEPAKVNIYGGAIALGHALGSSGSRMMATLVHALRRPKARYGVAPMCIGVGQGIAGVVDGL